MSIDNNYTGDSMKKRVDTLEKTVFGGDKPQESLVSMFHNINKLIQEFIENDKRVKKQIILFLIGSIASSISCIFVVGYKSAEFDMMKENLKKVQHDVAIIKDYKNEKYK